LRDKKNIADIITKDPISIFLEEQDNEWEIILEITKKQFTI
jgi:hypothetical protein